MISLSLALALALDAAPAIRAVSFSFTTFVRFAFSLAAL